MAGPISSYDFSHLLDAPESLLPATSPYRHFASMAELARRVGPHQPVHGLRPHVIAAAARWFTENFPGDVLYAVKCNPDPHILRLLNQNGVTAFDVASLVEVETVANLLPQAELFFMHPVKSRHAIRRAYADYGVRDFALDSFSELEKILEETGDAEDLGLHIRITVPKGKAFHALETKFGADFDDAVALLRRARRIAKRVGICFHVGSQTMTPEPYRKALRLVKKLLKAARVEIDSLDVGGGYPVAYPGLKPKPLHSYMTAIREGIEALGFKKNVRIMGEPGRALVSEAGSVLARVELRKGNMLYLNDGVYGNLFDLGMTGLKLPIRALRVEGRAFRRKQAEFGFYGPTCDSIDVIKTPYRLPADIREGDWIEFGQIGSYGAAMQSRFNGFFAEEMVMLDDMPLLKTPGYWRD